MDRNRKRQVFFVALLVVAVVMAILLRPRTQSVEPNEPDYYTGPRRSKSNPSVWVNADGKIVPPPPGAPALPTNTANPRSGGE